VILLLLDGQQIATPFIGTELMVRWLSPRTATASSVRSFVEIQLCCYWLLGFWFCTINVVVVGIGRAFGLFAIDQE
jgi:hypothetical protein